MIFGKSGKEQNHCEKSVDAAVSDIFAKNPLFCENGEKKIIKSCAFTGHRDLTEPEKRRACEIMRRITARLMREHGTESFYVGGALGFDTAAAVALAHLKKDFAESGEKPPKIILVCPHDGQESRWKERDQKIYRSLFNYYDDKICLAERYYDGCMFARNRYMVDRADLVIACLDRARRTGGSLMTVGYAERKGIPVLNLFDEIKAGGIS